jgi:hypothetical protein
VLRRDPPLAAAGSRLRAPLLELFEDMLHRPAFF